MHAFGFRVASLLFHLTTPHFLSAIFLIGWTACSVFENFLAVYLKLFLSFGKLYLNFFLQYVTYFLGNMILNYSFCEGVLKHFIWDGHCFLLPTLRINSCLFSETLNFCGSTIILLTFHHPWHAYSYGAYFMVFFCYVSW